MPEDTHGTQVYLRLSPEMQRDLPASLDELLAQEGIDLPPEIALSTAPMPVAAGEPIPKDVAVVINVSIDLAQNPEALAVLIGTTGASISAIIFAFSRFLKDRGHTPRVVGVDEVIEVTGDDGRPTKQLARVRKLVEPGPALKAEIKARWKPGKGLAVDLDVES